MKRRSGRKGAEKKSSSKPGVTFTFLSLLSPRSFRDQGCEVEGHVFTDTQLAEEDQSICRVSIT